MLPLPLSSKIMKPNPIDEGKAFWNYLIFLHNYDQMHSFKDKQEDMDVSPKSEFARLESVG